jgi:DNA-directed RNA polymerase specialized sigma24 family protein
MMSADPVPDERFFHSVVERKIVERIARKQTRLTSLSWEDAAQVAYEKIWRSTQAGKFRTGDVDDYCHWAVRVAYCAIFDYRRHFQGKPPLLSLDQPILGTDIPLVETLVYEFDGLDAIAKADLLCQTIAAITDLDRRYPKYRYLAIWQGLVQGKKQVDLAAELQINQPEICSRWRRIRHHVAAVCAQSAVPPTEHHVRQRSDEQW